MTKEEAIQAIVEDCINLLRAKGNDYQDDISPLGMRGCFANIFRKTMRLKSMIWEDREVAVKDETLEDTILDLINYGIITELLRRGEWTLEWGENKVQHDKPHWWGYNPEGAYCEEPVAGQKVEWDNYKSNH